MSAQKYKKFTQLEHVLVARAYQHGSAGADQAAQDGAAHDTALELDCAAAEGR